MPDTAPDLVSNTIGLLSDVDALSHALGYDFPVGVWEFERTGPDTIELRLDYRDVKPIYRDDNSLADPTRPDTNEYRGRHRHPDIHPS